MGARSHNAAWDRGDEKAFDRKYQEWQVRDWLSWLRDNLSFPFQAERMEDMYLDSFASAEMKEKNRFPVGCQVPVIGISDGDFEPYFDGVIVDVRR